MIKLILRDHFFLSAQTIKSIRAGDGVPSRLAAGCAGAGWRAGGHSVARPDSLAGRMDGWLGRWPAGWLPGCWLAGWLGGLLIPLVMYFFLSAQTIKSIRADI